MAKSKTKTEVGTASVSTVKLPREKVVRDKLLEAKGALENGYLEMAQLISEAFHKEFHLKWGFGTFREYCEQELEIGYHKATYFMDIWDKVKTLELPKGKVTKLGWTRMKDIAAVVTKENAEELLEKASHMSSRELTETVKTMRKSDTTKKDKGVPVTVTFSVKMGESEHRVVLDAIEEAKKLLETDQTTLALETICSDWMEAKGGQPSVTALEDYIAYLESVFPVKISFKSVKKTKAPKQEAPLEEEEEAVPEKATAKGGKKGAKKGAKAKKAAKAAPVEEDLEDETDLDSSIEDDDDTDINALLGIDDDE